VTGGFVDALRELNVTLIATGVWTNPHHTHMKLGSASEAPMMRPGPRQVSQRLGGVSDMEKKVVLF
jgi:hypothetical protein